MVMFESDSVVQPRESSWFGFYKPGQDSVVEDMRSRPIYTEDWIGLQQLDKLGRLKLLSSPGNHLRFTDEWFLTNIIKPYLA
jgi:palmitoyl-protein thioesterase